MRYNEETAKTLSLNADELRVLRYLVRDAMTYGWRNLDGSVIEAIYERLTRLESEP